MNLLYVLMMGGALVINIPWFMMIRRRGRIASHSRSRLQSVSRQKATSGSGGGDGFISGNMGTTLKAHVRSGLLTKLQPHHLPLLFLYSCTLYVLTRPDLGQTISRLFSVTSTASMAASSSLLPSWLSSRIPDEFPFAIPDADGHTQSRKQPPLLEPQLLSQSGQALISILSMVTGLLLSYKSSSALGKWEKGKGVWIGAGAGSGGMSGGIKGEIRSAVRMISLLHSRNDSQDEVYADGTADSSVDMQAAASNKEGDERAVLLDERAGELVSLLIGFAFALHFHLAHTRPPLQKAPLFDLLPKGYLATVRRTVERVRFRKTSGDLDEDGVDDGRSQSGKRSGRGPDKTPRQKQQSPLRTRSISATRQRRVRMGRASSSNEDLKAEPKGTRVTSCQVAVDGFIHDEPKSLQHGSAEATQSVDENTSNNEYHDERSQQYKQLNVPISTPEVTSGIVHTDGDLLRFDSSPTPIHAPNSPGANGDTNGMQGKVGNDENGSTAKLAGQAGSPPREALRQKARPKAALRSNYDLGRQASAISNPFPSNLPLSIIRLVESYVNQFVTAEAWTAAQGEKGYLLTRTLTKLLSEAEMLSENPPPLSLSIHLTHLLLLYLLAIPAQLMPVLGKWTVPVALVAGWGLLGVEALSREVGAVFGTSENHIPTCLYCAEILSESLDISPLFLEAYTSRVRARLENDEELAGHIPELIRKGDPRVLVLARLQDRRVEQWLPDFGL